MKLLAILGLLFGSVVAFGSQAGSNEPRQSSAINQKTSRLALSIVTDAARLREAGIRGVLESPTGSYKYKFSPTNVISIGVPGLNNALDNAKQWTVNGGAILQ